MGLLIDGTWHDKWYDTAGHGGRFVRSDSQIRQWVGLETFPAVPGRYHLYAAHACPWAHRTTIFRLLKGLEHVIGLSHVAPDMLERGWPFDETHPDPLFDSRHLSDVYVRHDSRYTGRVTVPVLWDTHSASMVNNESSEIIRMLDTAFEDIADESAPLHGITMYPPELRDQIDTVNGRIYEGLNNGVYRAGFATSQDAYDEAVREVFHTLDWLEHLLAKQRFVVGDRLTEADWRLFTTLVRFDTVYHHHFKCSLRQLQSYDNLWAYTRALYQFGRVRETVDIDSIRRHYFFSHDSINPHRIIPVAPDLDFDAPHNRGPVLAL